ncbi:MAG: M28 family peptidase [Armatimonadetes bacterium]|nr:M28 family peptidase [Armatimonadota bacterium]
MGLALLICAVAFDLICLEMPGRSYRGPLPPVTAHQRDIEAALRGHVEKLAGEIGDRNTNAMDGYRAAEQYIVDEFEHLGYGVERQTYRVDGESCSNLIAEQPGGELRDEIVVVGAHYDSVGCVGCPGANDNASGVALVLYLAEAFAGSSGARTLRFVAFANEEPPYFWTANQGSLVYAKECRRRGDRIVAVFTPDTMGYYTDRPHSQKYPLPIGLLYPNKGNFLGIIGNVRSRALVRRTVKLFRTHAMFPSEGIAAPGVVPGIGWSDHWSFWKEGYPAVMFSDGGPWRYPYYHKPADTPEKLDYERFARAVDGIEAVVAEVAEASR